MFIKRLNKIVDILNKKNHAAGIDSDIDQLQIIITHTPGNEVSSIGLKIIWHDHSIEHNENSSSRFWNSVPDNFDLQKYVKECLEQLDHK